ncbi:MAG: hypothetical protein IT267_12655 [Saprospiraceae bacterium]|nr:hypothetical protein [Saprospiraceae bacterium]
MKLAFLVSVFLFFTFAFNHKSNIDVAQSQFFPEYINEWSEIDSLKSKGLIEEALIKLEILFTRSTIESNYPQIFKTLLNVEELSSQKDELKLKGIISRIEAKLFIIPEPTKSLVKSILGSLYQNSTRNSFRRNSKTNIQGEEQDSTDIETWSPSKLIHKGNQYILESLQNEELKNADLNDYRSILYNAENISICSTLYELLLNRSVDHFSNPTNALTEFDQNLGDDQVFAELDTFINSDLHKHSVFSIYSNWLKYLKLKEQSNALVVANLKRLEYAYHYSDNKNKLEHYITSLEDYYKSLIHHPSGEIVLRKLMVVKMQFTEEANQNFVEIDSLCDTGIKMYKDSVTINFLSGIKNELRRPELSCIQESAILPKEYSKFLLQYKNLNEIYLRIYKVPLIGINDLNIHFEQLDETILKKFILIKSWKDDWQSPVDFKMHSVELAINPLTTGRYFILASDSKNLENASVKSGSIFFVTNLAGFQYSNKNVSKIFVVDRKKGTPIKGAKVHFFKQNYDLYDQKNNYVSVATEITNKEGSVVAQSSNYNLQYYLSKGNDHFYENSSVNRVYSNGSNIYKQDYFFTDRAIYRPGQTIYFKLLSLNQNSNGTYPNLNKKKDIEVSLRNANYQEIGKLNLRTNNFGSASGSFVLPITGLNGAFQITTNHGGASIQVEEYKRPNFEIVFDTLTETYKLGDQIQLKGTVKTFNGIPIKSDKIKYKVKLYLNEFPFYRYSYFNQEPPQIIESGNTNSNEKGEFSISFDTKPSLSNNDSNLSYTFAIEVEATDLNQETQSGETRLNLSPKDLFIQSNGGKLIDLNTDYLTVKTTNFINQLVRCDLNVSIYTLKAPDRVYKSRLWSKPDIQKFTEDEFRKLFPDDLYMNEDLPENWKTEKLVFNKEYKNESELTLNLKKLGLLPSDCKIIIVAKDEKDNQDTLTIYTTLINEKSISLIHQPSVFLNSSKTQPEEELRILHFKTELPYYVYYSLHSLQNEKTGWLNVSKQSVVSYKVLENDRGGIQYKGICHLNNRRYSFIQTAEVPWNNKILSIESVSFRDKVLPGDKEKWAFKIKDSINSSEKYEVLASMYDQSLDQIKSNPWNFNILPVLYSNVNLSSQAITTNYWISYSNVIYNDLYASFIAQYPQLNDFNILNSYYEPYILQSRAAESSGAPPNGNLEDDAVKMKSDGKQRRFNEHADQDGIPDKTTLSTDKVSVQFRNNLKETVFFYPELYTDSTGLVNIEFTMNEAMTKWKLQLFSHSMDLKFGQKVLEVVTQKPIQIKSYCPRFLRQNDKIQIAANLTNLSDEIQHGYAELEILDAVTLVNIGKEFIVGENKIKFNVDKDRTLSISWNLKIPEQETRALLFRFRAIGNNHTDGEQVMIPVVSNSKLITETLPLALNANSIKKFNLTTFSKLKSNAIEPHQFTLEFSSNPVWYAVQALPYIMEYPHDCIEQIMSRIFANSIGVEVMSKYPKVASVLNKIIIEGKAKSKLLQNEELKSALLEETPWVLNAQSETEQMRRVAILMDMNNMNNELNQSVNKLRQRQNSDGSFSWFPGYRPDRYMTQHIAVQIAHLRRLNISGDYMKELELIARNTRPFLDYTIKSEYDELARRVKEGKASWENNNLSSLQLHYYYCKLQSSDWQSDKNMKAIDNYYWQQIENFWLQRNLYDQGLCALIAKYKKAEKLAKLITNSLKQRSLFSTEIGRYWKNFWSYHWNELPIETQALMIEVFGEVTNDVVLVDELKTWLLKNKQTQHWGTTKSTSEAIFSLLSFGTNLIEEFKPVEIKLGNENLKIAESSTGTLYFKNIWRKKEIKSDFENIQITNPNKSVTWGAAYLQYFQNLDEIENSRMKELTINKQLFLRQISGNREILKPLSEQNKIMTGDKVTVRLIIKSDRPMDYVHLKVMRSSGFEPIYQISGYHYSNGLAYYLSPRDVATDFFISYLPKGTFVIEYDLRASFKGEFSDGIASLQSMYAPEFSAFTKGIKVIIE